MDWCGGDNGDSIDNAILMTIVRLLVFLLLSYILPTSKVTSGWVPIDDSVQCMWVSGVVILGMRLEINMGVYR